MTPTKGEKLRRANNFCHLFDPGHRERRFLREMQSVIKTRRVCTFWGNLIIFKLRFKRRFIRLPFGYLFV
jgi:hypothetical protein